MQLAWIDLRADLRLLPLNVSDELTDPTTLGIIHLE
jgi:hypothetical protein